MSANIETTPEESLPPILSTRHFEPRTEPVIGGYPHEVDAYQTITFMEHHQSFSFEELRVNDYQENRGVIKHPSNNEAFSASKGLVLAKVTPLPTFSFLRTPTYRIKANHIVPLGADIITFRVGEGETSQDFAIHKTLAETHSEFVRLAMKKDWKEARERIIRLPDDHPDAFTLWQQWLYFKHIPSNSFSDDPVKDANENRLLVQAYVLGERLMAFNFQDSLVDAIIDKLRHSSLFDPSLTNLVYDNTPPQSPLRKLWLDIYIFAGDEAWLNEDNLENFLHAEFTLELSRYQMSLKKEGRTVFGPEFEGWQCTYHRHVDGVCYRAITQAPKSM